LEDNKHFSEELNKKQSNNGWTWKGWKDRHPHSRANGHVGLHQGFAGADSAASHFSACFE